MLPIEVTARFDTSGQIQPLSFSLEAANYTISQVGRRWEDSQGQHFLVMAPLKRVFELLYVPPEACWYLRRTGVDRFFA